MEKLNSNKNKLREHLPQRTLGICVTICIFWRKVNFLVKNIVEQCRIVHFRFKNKLKKYFELKVENA
jgi:hypothetical protein